MPHAGRIPLRWAVVITAVGGSMVCYTPSGAESRRKPVVQKDFRIFDYHRDSQKRKTLLHGSEAEYLEHPVPIRGMTLETYTPTGATSLLARAETCFVDRTNRLATSPGPIQISLSDGGFSLSGRGFSWSFTNLTLVVSNQVESIIRGDLMGQTLPR